MLRRAFGQKRETGPEQPFAFCLLYGLGAVGARRSEVKEEGRPQAGPGDMSGGGQPPPSAREPLECNMRNSIEGRIASSRKARLFTA